jgi:hypothetical protein
VTLLQPGDLRGALGHLGPDFVSEVVVQGVKTVIDRPDGPHHPVHQGCAPIHVPGLEASDSQGVRPQSQSAGDRGRPLVSRNVVLVHDDVRGFEGLLRDESGQAGPGEIQQHDMVVRTPGNNRVAALLEGLRKRACVVDDTGGELGEIIRCAPCECARLARHGVHRRRALEEGENGALQHSGEGLASVRRQPIGVPPHQNESTTRTEQLLVRARSGDMRVIDRAGVQSRRHQSCDVRYVGQQQRSDIVGDGAELREVHGPRVGGCSADD